MQVLIYSKIIKPNEVPYVQELIDALYKEAIYTYVYTPYFEELIESGLRLNEQIAAFDNYYDFRKHKIDFVIVLGGDGTMLSATTLVRDANVPLIGINLGRMGFLASIDKKLIADAVISLKTGRYSLEERGLLYLESNLPIFEDIPFALNDCTLLKRDTSSMITIHTFINGDFLNSYWADGIIIATPTGSTGYSLSCGGPIIFPTSSSFLITPVAPHNLNVRPIVISDDAVVSFEIEGRAENFLCTLDSRFATITSFHQIAIRKCDFTIRLVQLNDMGFLQTLRKKLAWGSDIRN
ncbi:MAG: NAD kinase [Saprospiraceae bacterium]|nr:NAD kinase [Saprospiraceae bacterium]